MKKALIVAVVGLIGAGIVTAWIGKSKQGELTERRGQMKLTSPAFTQEEQIPEEYTCDGENVNPPLTIAEVPEGTQSLALMVEDPDAPSGTWSHWLIWNLKPESTEIMEDSVPEGAIQGTNDFKEVGYNGPCPPSGTHRYIFRLYALDALVSLEEGADRGELEEAMEEHILDSAELVGLYTKDEKLE
jgi:hypothetical protein